MNTICFKAWPDHGTPGDPDGVLSFIDDINRRMIKNSQEADAPEQVDIYSLLMFNSLYIMLHFLKFLHHFN